MRTVRCSSRLLGGVYTGEVSAWGRCMPGGASVRDPPREQNDRRLWKHYLAATTLPKVMNGSNRGFVTLKVSTFAKGKVQ